MENNQKHINKVLGSGWKGPLVESAVGREAVGNQDNLLSSSKQTLVQTRGRIRVSTTLEETLRGNFIGTLRARTKCMITKTFNSVGGDTTPNDTLYGAKYVEFVVDAEDVPESSTFHAVSAEEDIETDQFMAPYFLYAEMGEVMRATGLSESTLIE